MVLIHMEQVPQYPEASPNNLCTEQGAFNHLSWNPETDPYIPRHIIYVYTKFSHFEMNIMVGADVSLSSRETNCSGYGNGRETFAGTKVLKNIRSY